MTLRDLKYIGQIAFVLCLSGCTLENLVELEHQSAAEPKPIIHLKIKNYCPTENYRYVDFFLTMRSLVVEKNVLRDGDRDGVPNLYDFDSDRNLHPKMPDTNGDGYRDLVIHWAGIAAENQKNLKFCFNPGQDSDSDGFNDCEESLIGTEPLKPDTDGDGISDRREIEAGMNPLSGMDARTDSDSDGQDNYQEVKANTPVSIRNDDIIESYALKYTNTQVIESANCSDIFIENISLVSDSAGNLLRLEFLEESLDAQGRQLKSYSVVVPPTQKGGATLEYEYSELGGKVN